MSAEPFRSLVASLTVEVLSNAFGPGSRYSLSLDYHFSLRRIPERIAANSPDKLCNDRDRYSMARSWPEAVLRLLFRDFSLKPMSWIACKASIACRISREGAFLDCLLGEGDAGTECSYPRDQASSYLTHDVGEMPLRSAYSSSDALRLASTRNPICSV